MGLTWPEEAEAWAGAGGLLRWQLVAHGSLGMTAPNEVSPFFFMIFCPYTGASLSLFLLSPLSLPLRGTPQVLKRGNNSWTIKNSASVFWLTNKHWNRSPCYSIQECYLYWENIVSCFYPIRLIEYIYICIEQIRNVIEKLMAVGKNEPTTRWWS